MNTETYEQPALTTEAVGDYALYLKENLDVKLTFYYGEALDMELPITVELAVVEAGVSVRGDTATGVTKKVRTETGLEVQVPNFIESGDTIKVDTRTGTYVTRV
jgi:elongation factor P